MPSLFRFLLSPGFWAPWSSAGCMSWRSSWSQSKGRCPRRCRASKCAADGWRPWANVDARCCSLHRHCGTAAGARPLRLRRRKRPATTSGIRSSGWSRRRAASSPSRLWIAPIWSGCRRLACATGPVESSDLAPVMAPDTSGLPLDLWRGLEMADLERLLAGLDLPPRSPALHQLWRRMLLSSASPPAGAPSADHFMALRLEALYRSGLLGDMAEVSRSAAPGRSRRSPAGAQGHRSRRARGGLRNDQVAGGAAGGFARTPEGRGSGADRLLRSGRRRWRRLQVLPPAWRARRAWRTSSPLRVLDGLSMGTKPQLALPGTRARCWTTGSSSCWVRSAQTQVLDKAEPALLVALAGAPTSDLRMRTAAAEAALRLNALSPEAVAEVYRRQPAAFGTATPNERGRSARCGARGCSVPSRRRRRRT